MDKRLICLVFDAGAKSEDNRLVEYILVFVPYSFSEAVIVP